MAQPRKLRILCLHGYRQNDQIFREKTGGMRKMFKKYAEFFFVSAPHEPNPVIDGGVPSTESRTDGRGWWFSRPEQQFSSRHETDMAEGFDASVEAVRAFAEEHGPFDGVLGFSQGASMTHLLLAKAQLGELSFPVRFAVLAAGFLSLSTVHDKYTSVPLIDLPTLHIYGSGDDIVKQATSEKLESRFPSAVHIIHEGGHCVPSFSKTKTVFAEFLEERLKEVVEAEKEKEQNGNELTAAL